MIHNSIDNFSHIFTVFNRNSFIKSLQHPGIVEDNYFQILKDLVFVFDCRFT